MMWKLEIEHNSPGKCLLSVYWKIDILLDFCSELHVLKMRSIGFKCYLHEVEECCTEVIEYLVKILSILVQFQESTSLNFELCLPDVF